jgi:DNA invertase Pin-like site-specific DNA recombinase
LLGILGSVAQLEASMISERTENTLAHLRKQGKRVSGRIPWGWDCKDGKNLKPNAGEQKTLAWMQGLQGKGYSCAKIAKALEAKGIQPKYGKVWYPGCVYRILRRAVQETQAA